MHRNHAKGFTLVEMSLVIVIFGIVLTISVLGTTRLVRSNRLVGATNTLVADLRQARSLASTEGTSFLILFQPSGYSICRTTPAQVVSRRTCPAGVTCTASDTATFYAWGLTAPITITLANSERSKVVQLAANGNITR